MNPLSKFGVELKSAPVADEKDDGGVNRSKASVYAWDDPRLQKTAVVNKRIAKAATVVQRFIRACISHWQYYNEERIPLEEELRDINRRRKEELEDVIDFKKRGFEEALFEIEAEMAMPREEFMKCQKLSKELKQAIEEEKEVILQTEKDIHEQKQLAKKLGREKHEMDAQHTMSRLDVDIPVLEAENKELTEVHDQFEGIARALKNQRKELERNIQLEQSHKRRLLQGMAKILKELQGRGAKPKLIHSLQLTIKYKGETPPPKPPKPAKPAEPVKPAEQTEEQTPEQATESRESLKEVENSNTNVDQNEEKQATVGSEGGNLTENTDMDSLASNDLAVGSDAGSTQNQESAEAEAVDTNADADGDDSTYASSLSDADADADATGENGKARKGRALQRSKESKERGAPAKRSVKKNLSMDSKASKAESVGSHHSTPPEFNWGARSVSPGKKSSRSKSPSAKSKSRSKSPSVKSKSRSKSPSAKGKPKGNNKNDNSNSNDKNSDDEAGFSWDDMQKIEHQKKEKESGKEPKKNVSKNDKITKKDSDNEIGFNWGDMQKIEQHKKEKEKSKVSSKNEKRRKSVQGGDLTRKGDKSKNQPQFNASFNWESHRSKSPAKNPQIEFNWETLVEGEKETAKKNGTR